MKITDIVSLPEKRNHLDSCRVNLLDLVRPSCDCGSCDFNETLLEISNLELDPREFIDEEKLAKVMFRKQPYLRYSVKEMTEWAESIIQNFQQVLKDKA